MVTFMGGGTDPAAYVDVYQGIKVSDQARTERGIVGLTLPPCSPVFDAVRDVFDLFDGKEKKTIKSSSCQVQPIHQGKRRASGP